ncbi:MAG: hypothetical protein Q4G23_03255 [Clostridia bacterium]|nr:hypothetical protein [Clostridia bacterium]
MKNTIKRLMAVLLTGIMLFAFIGCSTAKKAENAVASLLDALKAMDLAKAAEYASGGMKKDSLFDTEAELFVEGLVSRMEYKITGSEVVDESTVNVNVSITNVDMKPVLSEFMASAWQYAIASLGEDPAPTEEESNAKMLEILTECLNREGLEMVTHDATVTVKLVEGKWQVEMGSSFVNAIFGGLEDATKEMQSSMGF